MTKEDPKSILVLAAKRDREISECQLMVGENELSPASFQRFLEIMFSLLGHNGSRTTYCQPTPTLRDGQTAITIRNFPKMGKMDLSITQPLLKSGQVLNEVVHLDKDGESPPKLMIRRTLTNQQPGQKYTPVSYVSQEEVDFRGDSPLRVGEVDGRVAVVVAGRIFSAWQRSQGPYAAAPV